MNQPRAILLLLCLILLGACGGGPVASDKALKLFQQGKEAFLKQELDPAAAFFAAAVQDSSGFVNGWVMLGKTRFFLKDVKGAEEALVKAVAIAPTHVEARYFLSRIRILRKDMNGAIRDLLEILEVDPNNSRANYSLGSLYAQAGNLKASFRHFALALREETMLARIRLTWADTLLRAGLKERARQVLEPATAYPAHETLKKDIRDLMEKLK